MEVQQLLTWIIGTFTGLGVLLAGLGYGYGQFKKGVKAVDSETIDSLQVQLDTFKGEMTLLKNDNEELRKDNKELVATNNKLQGQMETYKEIAQNQNPELKELLSVLAKTVPPLIEAQRYCQKHNLSLAK